VITIVNYDFYSTGHIVEFFNLSVTIKPIMLGVSILNVVKLSVIRLIVAAPYKKTILKESPRNEFLYDVCPKL
jgi:hypothetical protein